MNIVGQIDYSELGFIIQLGEDNGALTHRVKSIETGNSTSWAPRDRKCVVLHKNGNVYVTELNDLDPEQKDIRLLDSRVFAHRFAYAYAEL